MALGSGERRIVRSERYCAQRGTGHAADRACAAGRGNDEHQQFCGVCGALISATPGKRLQHRSPWLVSVIVTQLAAGIVTAMLAITRPHAHVSASATSGSANPAIQQWWSLAQEHFNELQRAVNDLRNLAHTGDLAGVRDACGQLDDAGAGQTSRPTCPLRIAT